MKLCTFAKNKASSVGIAIGEKIVDLNEACKHIFPQKEKRYWQSIQDLLNDKRVDLENIRYIHKKLEEHAEEVELLSAEKLTFLPPIMNPPKFMCLAGNYIEHIQEGRKEKANPPKDIHVFIKPSGTSILGTGEDIVVKNTVSKLDYELELGFVIGKRGRYIPESEALEHVAGYTIINDISDREYMPSSGKPIHWFAMKAQDGFGPSGPFLLISKGEKHPIDLEMKLRVNGELRQHARTSDMYFNVAQITSRLSEYLTLEVGDMISTGTPAGNGWSRNKFLQEGDVVEAEIERIGILKNTIRFESAVYRSQ